MRPDILLADSLHTPEQTTMIDQRVGVQAQTFNNNGGALQTGDYAIQNNALTNTQIAHVAECVSAVRDVLARPDLEDNVKEEVAAVVDDIEAASAGSPEPRLLHSLITRATIAAAGTAGTAAGGALIQSLAALGKAIM